jgi:hypothetical protein
MQQSVFAQTRRRIRALTLELERLGTNPMLDSEQSRNAHKEIWREIDQHNAWLQENEPKRKPANPAGGRKHGQRHFAI